MKARYDHPAHLSDGTVDLELTVDDDAGDRVTVRLLNPPAGLALPPLQSIPAPFSSTLRWQVSPSCAGTSPLRFFVSDDRGGSVTVDFALDLDAMANDHAYAANADVTGDGRLDLIVAAPRHDEAGITDTGAVYVWSGHPTPSALPDATLIVPGAAANDSIGSAGASRLLIVDVTGDGVLDVICGSSRVDDVAGGKGDRGAFYVWAGGAALVGVVGPIATLQGRDAGCDFARLRAHDLDRDGTSDLLGVMPFADHSLGIADTGAIAIWLGGATLTGTVPPHAILEDPTAQAGDQLGSSVLPLAFGDVTGDGIDDVVVAAPESDHAAVDAGAFLVWDGASALAGLPAPLATLRDPAASDFDHLGVLPDGSMLLGDVTGDGVADVISGSPEIDGNGHTDIGGLCVFAGGKTLAGLVDPHAVLHHAGAISFDCLTFADAVGAGMQLADLDGDGTLDVLAGASNLDVGAIADQGGVAIFFGGSNLSGAVTQDALLVLPSGSSCAAPSAVGRGLFVADVTGDDALDVIVASRLYDGPRSDQGALAIFAGGAALTGQPAPAALLLDPAGDSFANLGAVAGGIQLRDVVGDGHVDLVVAAPNSDPGAVDRAGAILVWSGGALTGTPAPDATLAATTPTATDRLGLCEAPAVQFGDVTGDGRDDLVVGAGNYDVDGVTDCGALLVFDGAALAGAVAPFATLALPFPKAGARISGNGAGEGGFALADLNGDRVADVLASAEGMVIDGIDKAGALFVWRGGAAIAGTPTPTALTDAAPVAGDELGKVATGPAFHLFDFTGDGTLDVLGLAPRADLNGVTDTGEIHLFRGGSGLTGAAVDPLVSLRAPTLSASARLGDD